MAQGNITPLLSLSLNTIDFSCDKTPIKLSYKTNEHEYDVKIIKINLNAICNMNINGHDGGGFVIKSVLKENTFALDLEPPTKVICNKILSKNLVLKLSDNEACDTDLCGGKGSSLAQLTKLQKCYKNETFLVPDGYVVTTNAYNLLVNENKELNIAINKLEKYVW